MLRNFLLLSFLLTANLSLQAQGAIPDGNYRLAMIVSPTIESTQAILKVETKDGNQTASFLAVQPRSPLKLISYKSTGKEIVITLSNGLTFTSATPGPDKSILGSFTSDTFSYRGKLAPTDKSTIEQGDFGVRLSVPEAFTKAVSLANRPMALRFQAQNQKDAAKKKELQDQIPTAQKEADEKVAGLYREVIEKHSDNLASLDAAINLLGMASKAKLTADEADKLVKIMEKHATPYGPGYSQFVMMRAAMSLRNQKGLERFALQIMEPVYRSLSSTMPASRQQPVIFNYLETLKANNKLEEIKPVETRLAKLEIEMDREYLSTVPPFKPARYTGRKDKTANQVAVLELFTGAQCPPCVAADVAFDALEKAYDHKDLVLIQYHMHIPGPDPLTNPDSVARFAYYRKLFPNNMRGTPSTLFNGKPDAGGGGNMAMSQSKFDQYKGLIDPMLEKSTPVKLNGTASRDGDNITIQVDVYGVEDNEKLNLKLLIVEESVKYTGSNKLRFHHQVARAMPGGTEGVAIKDKNFKHQVSTDISKIRSELNNYLDEYAQERPFPSPHRPLDMKNLKVIALVQNDATAEIVQACQIDVAGKVAGR